MSSTTKIHPSVDQGIVAAKALGVDEGHVQRLVTHFAIDGGQAQVLLMHVASDRVDGLDARHDAVPERAERGDRPGKPRQMPQQERQAPQR